MLGLIAAIVSYSVGSFPTAYVIGKRFRRIDLSRNGTGNIGAMNAYAVTGSKMIGVSVGMIDLIKGFSMTFLFDRISGLVIALVAALFVVLGHNFSVFMKFKGGRGLASSAGAFLVIQPIAVGVYLVTYFILRGMGLRLYLSSVAGIILAAVAVCYSLWSKPVALALAIGVVVVVMSKHIVPLKNELKNAS